VSGSVWSVEKDDGGGIYVFDASNLLPEHRANEFATEREALECGIDCAVAHLEAMQRSLTYMRRRLRTIKRRKSAPHQGVLTHG